MTEESKTHNDIKPTEQQSQAITDTIKTNPLKHAVAPGKASLGEAIEMGDKLKHTAPNQVSIGLDRYEENLAKQRKIKIH
ncbi:MAG: hypothetical protein CR971_01675 [candidate division SR1 bacterium]|nr:MAG: hypothetical protein CR971_01675 [candidate division SR1 bacterium]